MTTARVTVTDGKIFDPLKIRLTQEGGDIDTIVFEISPFTFWDINLSQYDCYVTALGKNNNIDEKKLSYTIDGQKMTIVWSLDDYTLEIGNALIYQLVFKAQDSSAKIWQSYKGLIYVNSEIEESEDEPGPEDYPTILRQFELGLEELERQAFYAYYWMPLGAWIPFQNREKRRLYLNRLTDYDNSCIIEDDNGNIISPSAQTISFDPGNSGLPENLQDAISNIAARAKHCPRFCVNFGNTAAGDADLLSSFSGTLSFKVGDSFPSLTATLANGETIDLAHIDSLNCGDLPNNDYNIFVFKDGTARALHNVIYRQVTQPVSPLNGDIWFCAPTNSAKQWNTSGYSITQVTSSITESIIDATMNSTMILAITGNKAYKSTDNGVTWSQSISSTFDMCCCAYFNEKFFIGCSSGKVLYTADSGITWDEVDVDDTSCKVCGMCYYGTNYFAFLSDGSVFSSTDLSSWTKVATIGTSNEILDVEYHDGTFLACGIRGKIYKSIDGTTWAEKLSNTTCTFTRARWLTGTTWALCSTSFPSTIAISTNDGDSWSLFSIPGSATLDIGYVNSSFIVTAFDGILHGTDFSNMRMIPGNNRHYNVVLGTLLLGICGKVATFADSSCWYDFSGIPIGKITIDNGEISSLENFPINNNGYDINSGVVATTTTHGLIKVASADDEKDETNAQSSITPSNIFRILDYRRTNTEYSVGDIVGCPYHR